MKHLMPWRRTALRAVLMLTLAAVFHPASADAGAFSAADLKRMSTFVSNFTEVNFPDFDMQKGDAPPNPALIRFGVLHNVVNNSESRIKHCEQEDCRRSPFPLVMDAKFAAESVRKYFDLEVQHRSVSDDDGRRPLHFDGKSYYFDASDVDSGGDPIAFAKVTRATKEGGVIRMTGDIYSESNAEPTERIGTFTVTAKPHKWNGKNTWAILSLKREYR